MIIEGVDYTGITNKKVDRLVGLLSVRSMNDRPSIRAARTVPLRAETAPDILEAFKKCLIILYGP